MIKVLKMSLPYILLLFFVFSFSFQSDLSFNQDLGMHLTLGKIIWSTKSIPKTNLFSYTYPQFQFINHHWLFEVLAYIGSITLGIQAVLLVKIFLLLVSVFIIVYITKQRKALLLLPIGFLFLHLIRDRVDLRPEILSYFFTALTLFILECFETSSTKLVYFLPFISLLWVNTHIFFPVGLAIQCIYFLHVCISLFIFKKKTPLVEKQFRALTVAFFLSLLATLCNPNLLQGALYPFTVFNNYGVTIVENQSVFVRASFDFMNHDYLFFYLSLFIVAATLFINIWKEKVSFKSTALLLLGLALACQSIKGLPYLFFISLPFIVGGFAFLQNRVWIQALNVLVGICIIFEGVFYLSGVYYTLTYKPNTPQLIAVESEKSAINFLIRHHLPQPIFNSFGTGGYLLYRTYPIYKVFVDERPEAYPASFFQDIYLPMQRSYALFKKEEAIYTFKTVLFNITDQDDEAITFLNAITRDPQWKTVFLDEYNIILVRDSVQKQLDLPIINLANQQIKNYHYQNAVPYTNLSTLFFNLHYFDEAKEFNRKALTLSPNNPAANNIMEHILLQENVDPTTIDNFGEKSTNMVFW